MSGQAIKVGIAVDLSGDDAVLAEVGTGATAYFNYINNNGGVNGYKITWQTEDTQNSPAGTLTAVKGLISQGAQAILGAGGVSVVALRPVAASLKVPLLMAGDGTPTTKNFFGFAPNYDSMFPSMYDYARQLAGGGPIGLLYSNDANGIPAQSSIKLYTQAKSLPGPAVEEAMSADETDCTPFVAKLQSAGVKVVIESSNSLDAACAIKAAKSIGYRPKFLSDWAIAGEAYATSVGSLYPGEYVMDYENVTPAYTATMDKYDPADLTSAFSEQGWDGASILVEAIKLATAGGKAFSQTGLLNALNSGFTGQPVGLVSSGITFNSSEHYGVLKVAPFVTVAGGGERQVGPYITMPQPYGTAI